MKYPDLSPSVLFFITLIIGIFLSWMKPWHWSLYLGNETLRWSGLAILFISILLNTLAYRMFKKHLTPHTPFGIPTVLIDRGIFSLTRNPVYLALVLSQCGLGFVFDTVWLLLSAVVLLIMLDIVIIPDEEKILEGTFLKDYEEYKNNTRRWL